MIAQFATPEEALSVPLFPLVILGVVYVILFVTGRVLAGRGRADDADQLDRIAFIVMLAAAAYTLVLGVYAVAMRAELIWDLVLILLIVFLFFIALLSFTLLWEMAIGAIGRARTGRHRRRAATARPAEEPPAAAPPSTGQPG